MATDRLPGDSHPERDRRPEARPLTGRQQALSELSRPVAGKHDHHRPIPPLIVERVLDNEPFEDYPRAVLKARHALPIHALPVIGAALQQLLEGGAPASPQAFLRHLFPRLAQFWQVSFAPGRPAFDREGRAVRAACSRYLLAGLTAQAQELREAYDSLVTLRLALSASWQRSAFRRGVSGLLETAVPVRYLPELLLAAPVWFIEGKPAGGSSFAAAVRYFCDLGHSDPFAYVFQLYNDTPRAFGQFAGPDPVPLPLAGLITELAGRFDFLVIATPYHALAFVTLQPLPKEAPPPPPLPRYV